jgi:hypothetical protein
VPGFVAAQLVGGLIGLGLLALYPDADNVVVPHDTPTASPTNTDPRRP